jgi:geranylgeranyl pyrophosphate synthase
MLKKIESKLQEHLQEAMPGHPFKDILNYALFPVGKLFRPQLVYALAMDANNFKPCHEYFASSLETHHAYTLIHDDLPAMDDDDFRRGKPTVHKKFDEAKAILAGDALLNYSFQLLSKINPKKVSHIVSLYGQLTGAQGLILGQVLDLEDGDKSLEDTILIHQLKTSRLIQLALVGSNYLADEPFDSLLLMQLGDSLGIIFQLLDDLSELAHEITHHEKTINPFLKFDKESMSQIFATNFILMQKIIKEQKLVKLNHVISHYLVQSQNKITEHKSLIAKHFSSIDLIVDMLKF